MRQTITHPPKVYWQTCGALMLLLACSWAIGYIDLGLFNLVLALAIAMVKAALVVLIFMHIRGGGRLLHLAAGAGVLWLLILLALTLSDYATRN